MRDYEKICIVREMIKHINGNQYDDFVNKKFQQIKIDYFKTKKEKEEIEKRKQEISREFKSELLSNIKRNELVDEYNLLSFKYFGNTDYELYEALDLALYYKDNDIIDLMVLNILKLSIGRESEIVNDLYSINILIQLIKKIKKIFNYDFNTFNIMFNALLMNRIEELVESLNLNNKETKNNLLNTIPNYNLYNGIISLMVGIDIDTFINYYPIIKDYKNNGCKNYYSSKKELEEIKSKYGNIITEKSAIELLDNILFTEPILFDIAIQIFYIIEYNTNINTIELLENFLNKKNNFTIIK